MRTMLHFEIPVEAGNDAAAKGLIGPTLQKVLDLLKPEAVYFTSGHSGERGGFVVFDMKDSSEMVRASEPFFLVLKAKVRFYPVMNVADLQAGMPHLEQAVKEHGQAAGA